MPRPTHRVRSGVAALLLAAMTTNGTAAADPRPTSTPAAQPDFGPNVKIFDRTMPVSEIQAIVDAVAHEQIDDEMGTRRYALLFKPGTYGTASAPLHVQVGYYTEVAGLGAAPTDVVINGHVDVYNRCLTPTNCIALNNFWRSLSNLTINVSGQTGCRASGNFLGRLASGADAARERDRRHADPDGLLHRGSTLRERRLHRRFRDRARHQRQQQFLVRNSSIGGWSNAVWNQVFTGVQGAPATSFPNPPYTTLATTPVSREKPYLYVDAAGSHHVFVPALRTSSSGPSWRDGATPGRSIPLTEFFLARPSDSVPVLNAALASGKHLLFTPGVYDVDRSITITRPGTVVLGLGIATLTARDGAVPIQLADVRGVAISGLMIDAGPVASPVLLRVGPERRDRARTAAPADSSVSSDPTVLHDVFFRVGGPHVGKASVSLEVNSDDVIIDHLWAWRADHGVPGAFGWDVSTADTGVVVNGDDVTATGLFVEHYQKHNVVWNGENGRVIFFQNELPYDPPNQEAYQHDGLPGWAAYKVADRVAQHELWGAASYVFLTSTRPSMRAAASRCRSNPASSCITC